MCSKYLSFKFIISISTELSGLILSSNQCLSFFQSTSQAFLTFFPPQFKGIFFLSDGPAFTTVYYNRESRSRGTIHFCFRCAGNILFRPITEDIFTAFALSQFVRRKFVSSALILGRKIKQRIA